VDRFQHYAVGLVGLGIAGVIAGDVLGRPWVMAYAAVPAAVGAFLLYLDLDRWYCAMCGQVQGRLVKPKQCERCESNRFTKRDPGVGDAVRVKK